MRTRQWFLAVMLLLLGMYFLDNMVSGRIYFYINMNFGWLTWLGTGVLLLLGVTNVLDLVREAREGGAAHLEHECGEGDGHCECDNPDEHNDQEHSHGHVHYHAPS